ncbi:TetR/AcrR family transcriptional regulator [Gryllotalpicola protaetiae]|uniref:TetR/AcrR family transcriptional regulator n=1 Tax=Gryllotalpicola protaetiae TaxID=2419771 RepID=A0A387BSB5_9MICO|nr:TetR/AcrR family transcriptional regulator [Gryllotalpicola protaetiae]AYG03950.1 TetR/AcrR family transcriptional regulator [Gryllotalpicola protaetiae]
MTASEARGPYAKGLLKREEILRVALAAYDEHAGEGPSMKAIAERVGLSEQGLIHYFGTREALFSAILVERDRAYRETFASSDPIEKLRAAVRLQVQTPGLSRLYVAMAATASDPARTPHQFFSEHFRALSADVAQMLTVRPDAEPSVDAALGDRDTIEFVSRILIAAADGLQLRSLIEEGVDLESDLMRLAELFRALLAGNPPAGASKA